jgi:hypothetical protein
MRAGHTARTQGINRLGDDGRAWCGLDKLVEGSMGLSDSQVLGKDWSDAGAASLPSMC